MEYVLIADVNDSEEVALQLAELLKGLWRSCRLSELVHVFSCNARAFALVVQVPGLPVRERKRALGFTLLVGIDWRALVGHCSSLVPMQWLVPTPAHTRFPP